jgi:coenzyme F420-reducing hydrogenase gamma subunit
MMTAHKARWVLSCAVAKYNEGTRLLRVYGGVIDTENLKKIEETRARFSIVVDSAINRLKNEVQA